MDPTHTPRATQSRVFAPAAAVAVLASALSIGSACFSNQGTMITYADGGPDAASGSSGGTSSSSGSGSSQTTTSSGASSSQSSTTAVVGLHVVGNTLVDTGKTVRLLGVDHSGTEYECVQTGTTIFEGPSDSSLVTPMKAWGINTVRVPLNEDCWLGINGVASAVSGTAYQQAITTYVQAIRSGGMYAIVDLHWNGPSTTLASSQQPMPDEDHAGAFWTSVATAFKGDNGIIFDLYNEPYPDLGTGGMGQGLTATSDLVNCMLNGCMLSSWTGFGGSAQAAGMQELVTDVRNTGATNVIMIGGWSFANNIGAWLQFKPNDPLNNLAASFHNYNYTQCNNAACWGNNVQPIAAQVPVVTGELGENDCGESYVDSYFAWADPLGISYLGWAWNTDSCSSFPSLITAYSGSPTAFGQGFMTHLPTQNQ
jgi:hypothetical protein